LKKFVQFFDSNSKDYLRVSLKSDESNETAISTELTILAIVLLKAFAGSNFELEGSILTLEDNPEISDYLKAFSRFQLPKVLPFLRQTEKQQQTAFDHDALPYAFIAFLGQAPNQSPDIPHSQLISTADLYYPSIASVTQVFGKFQEVLNNRKKGI